VLVGIFEVLVSLICMKYSSKLFKYLGDKGFRVVTAIMAIIVLTISVQFLVDDMVNAVPQI
jgi:small neutral amino acid transporter SnatA (MarC family)